MAARVSFTAGELPTPLTPRAAPPPAVVRAFQTRQDMLDVLLLSTVPMGKGDVLRRLGAGTLLNSAGRMVDASEQLALGQEWFFEAQGE